MKLSMKGDYGVRAMIHLAQCYGQGPVQSAEIAGKQEIPEPYLDQLLTVLRRAGLIRSLRGPKGGHALARQPETIALGEVVQALEGPLSPAPCIDDDAFECGLLSVCGQRDVWLRLAAMTRGLLDSVTMAELAATQSDREARAMYHI